MELLEEVTYPKPLDELLTAAFETYASSQPWVRDFELSPKSVVRDLYERAMTFGEFIALLQARPHGGRRAALPVGRVPGARQTSSVRPGNDDLLDIIEWLGELVRQVDSSLVDEWEELVTPTPARGRAAAIAPPVPRRDHQPAGVPRAGAQRAVPRVQLAALDKFEELGRLEAEAATLSSRRRRRRQRGFTGDSRAELQCARLGGCARIVFRGT